MPCIKKCYEQTTHQFQPSTNFAEIKFAEITHLKESLKQNCNRSKFENCKHDVKNPGKLLMKLFLQKQKKTK